jgi:hypothetical protein
MMRKGKVILELKKLHPEFRATRELLRERVSDPIMVGAQIQMADLDVGQNDTLFQSRIQNATNEYAFGRSSCGAHSVVDEEGGQVMGEDEDN